MHSWQVVGHSNKVVGHAYRNLLMLGRELGQSLHRAISPQNHGDCAQKNAKIEKDRPFPHILEIHGAPLFDRERTPSVNLPTARDSWTHAEQQVYFVTVID